MSPYDIVLPSPQKKEPVGEYTTPSEMIRIVSRLADEYWERGKIVISKHRFFETPSRERIFRYVMNACRRTPEGKPRGFESSEKKACLSIQSELNKYEQRDRERMCEYVLSTYFGLSMEAVPELTLWQKTNIIGVLQSHLNLHTSFIVQFIQKAAEDAKLRQTALWNVADVDKAPGHSLAQLRLEDVW